MKNVLSSDLSKGFPANYNVASFKSSILHNKRSYRSFCFIKTSFNDCTLCISVRISLQLLHLIEIKHCSSQIIILTHESDELNTALPSQDKKEEKITITTNLSNKYDSFQELIYVLSFKSTDLLKNSRDYEKSERISTFFSISFTT